VTLVSFYTCLFLSFLLQLHLSFTVHLLSFIVYLLLIHLSSFIVHLSSLPSIFIVHHTTDLSSSICSSFTVHRSSNTVHLLVDTSFHYDTFSCTCIYSSYSRHLVPHLDLLVFGTRFVLSFLHHVLILTWSLELVFLV
jgi:hypothetical protein